MEFYSQRETKMSNLRLTLFATLAVHTVGVVDGHLQTITVTPSVVRNSDVPRIDGWTRRGVRSHRWQWTFQFPIRQYLSGVRVDGIPTINLCINQSNQADMIQTKLHLRAMLFRQLTTNNKLV